MVGKVVFVVQIIIQFFSTGIERPTKPAGADLKSVPLSCYYSANTFYKDWRLMMISVL